MKNHRTKRGGFEYSKKKVELNCPSEKIPENLTIDLDGVDIGESFKISYKIDPEVVPTIREEILHCDLAPTVMKEPETS